MKETRPDLCEELLRGTGVDLDEVDRLIPPYDEQALWEGVRKKLAEGGPPDGSGPGGSKPGGGAGGLGWIGGGGALLAALFAGWWAFSARPEALVKLDAGMEQPATMFDGIVPAPEADPPAVAMLELRPLPIAPLQKTAMRVVPVPVQPEVALPADPPPEPPPPPPVLDDPLAAELAAFEQASAAARDGSAVAAIHSLDRFLEAWPQGQFASEARRLLLDAYHRERRWPEVELLGFELLETERAEGVRERIIERLVVALAAQDRCARLAELPGDQARRERRAGDRTCNALVGVGP